VTDTATDLRSAFTSGSLAVSDAIARGIKYCREDPHNAIITVNDDTADIARASSERYQQQCSYGLWDGIPYVAKDNIATAGQPWTAGIEAYRERVATDDADLIAWLKQQGAILIGKSNLHEAALGTSTDNPWFGQCHHPHRRGFSPGGSSGGSAVAVAAGYVPLALGTDTMGSVRIPAAFCGVYGYKPGNGLISGNGVTPLSKSLDTIGLIASTARDLKIYGSDLVNNVTDSLAPEPPPVVGVLSDSAIADCTTEVVRHYQQACAELNRNNVSTVVVDWFENPTLNRRAGLTLCVHDAWREHEAALSVNPEGFSSELVSLLTFGRNLDSEKLANAKEQITQIKSHVVAHWSNVDVVLTPVTPCATHAFTDTSPVNLADYTAVANLTGAPSTAIPYGRCSNGLSLGLQLIGKSRCDKALLSQTRFIDKQLCNGTTIK